MSRVVILSAWLKNFKFNSRPNIEFYASNDKQKAQILKLRNDLGLQTQTNPNLHHIFPAKQILILMEFCQLQNQSELNKTCILLSNHCNNNPAIRKTVRQFIDQKNITSAIQSLWSSIYYFRKNLVFGPDATHRGDDPKQNGFDQPLFSQQSNNYQSQMQQCRSQFFNKNWNNALDMFLKLKPTSNVLWTFNKKLGKWFVAGSSKLPGNVGFDY